MDFLEEPEAKYNLLARTKKFSLDCILLTEKLPNTYLGNHIKGQLIRCSTSVASNYRAARHKAEKHLLPRLALFWRKQMSRNSGWKSFWN